VLARAGLGRKTQRRRVEDFRREQPLAIGITHCFAKPHAREDYVKVWLVCFLSRRGNSQPQDVRAPHLRIAATYAGGIALPRCGATHSCDLRIVAEISAGECQLTGITNSDDRFRAASLTKRSSSLDPKQKWQHHE
jgi:hypothetical protein